mgnify:CR=1 FL=1
MKMRDILSESERMEIAALKLQMARTNSLRRAKKYRDKIIDIMLEARERYLSETEDTKTHQ